MSTTDEVGDADSVSEQADRSGTIIRIVLMVILAIAAVVAYYFYYEYTSTHPSTDDAYVNTDIARIAPQVSGPVLQVHVDDHQFVNAGAVLFEIDPTLYKVAVEAARAQFDSAVQATDAGSASVRAAGAAVRQRQAALDNAQNELTRLRELAATGAVSRNDLDNAFAAAAEAQAAFEAARAQLDEAAAQLGPGTGDSNAKIRIAAAALQRAELDMIHTRVIAPTDGWVANLSLRPGAYVEAGGSSLALIAADRWWINSNFKETDIERIRVGQPATITLDMYPGFEFSGTVRSLSAGSGAAFSLLPPENASGNWVKVTQRFPVRIEVDSPANDSPYPLRVGASATVRVDTTDTATGSTEPVTP